MIVHPGVRGGRDTFPAGASTTPKTGPAPTRCDCGIPASSNPICKRSSRRALT